MVSVEDLEKQLSGYSISEMNTREKVLLSLMNGEVTRLSFEKSIVPADEIDRYVIVEHLFQTPFKSKNGHIHAELNSFKLYDDAVRFFSDKLSKMPEKNDDVGYISELMLVGKFKGKELQYYKDGDLNKCTGITLDYAFSMPTASYQLTTGLDPFRPVVLKEQMYAVIEANSKEIQFYDASLNKIDANFWKASSKDKVKQEIEEEPLLPKNKVAHNKGMNL